MRRFLLVGLVLAIVLAGAALAQSTPGARQANRAVVFVPGFGAASRCHENGVLSVTADAPLWLAVWFGVQSRLPELALDDRNDVFVYDYVATSCAPTGGVTPAAPRTCEGLDPSLIGPGHRQRFGAWFSAVAAEHPDTRFDIVGLSTGGLIAVSWAAGVQPESLAPVRTIVAMGSPLLGLDSDQAAVTETVLAGTPCSGAADLSPHSPAVLAATAPLSQPDCGVEPGAAVASRVPILTVRNARDAFVPFERACLPGAADFAIDDGCEITGHSCLFTNPAVHERLAAWLEGEDP